MTQETLKKANEVNDIIVYYQKQIEKLCYIEQNYSVEVEKGLEIKIGDQGLSVLSVEVEKGLMKKIVNIIIDDRQAKVKELQKAFELL